MVESALLAYTDQCGHGSLGFRILDFVVLGIVSLG